ncbi:hypothetical protein DVH24_034572 [Malus domestica]|uniref:Uncharacterized protein n=1 Tax=Malus domestica TaxID=3750 RepID=A0A498J135_MALDO|nr:hypothetical protein DVH24_034572 [Malus domestica]
MGYEIVMRLIVEMVLDGTGRDRTGRNGKGAKMPSDGNKEEEEGDGEVIILCSTNVKRVVPWGDAEQKFTQNSSHGTARSTRFRRTKRDMERLVPLYFIPSHVPNGTSSRNFGTISFFR